MPQARVIISRAELSSPTQGAGFAELLAGVSVDVLQTNGARVTVRTRGSIRLEGVVQTQVIGICAREAAPVRITQQGPTVGYVPKGWCFSILRVLENDVQLIDRQFGRPFLVAHRFLVGESSQRFDPIIGGFESYRLRAQPLATLVGATPYFQVPQGEWRIRATHEEDGHAHIEILGETVVLQGWERVTNLYADLFKERDPVLLARERLNQSARPGTDPRPWFAIRQTTTLHRRPGQPPVGQIDADRTVTVNRRHNGWSQIRLEERSRRGQPVGRILARLWVRDEYLRPLESAFD